MSFRWQQALLALTQEKQMSENMKKLLSVYDFNDSPVRVSMGSDGQPWFVAADVCRVLEIGNPSDVARALDEDEKMTLDNIEGQSGHRGGARCYTIISESGLYALIFKSRKPQAKAFRKWVTSEVLPAIRKTGGYAVEARTAELLAAERARQADMDYVDRVIEALQFTLSQLLARHLSTSAAKTTAALANQTLRALELRQKLAQPVAMLTDVKSSGGAQ